MEIQELLQEDVFDGDVKMCACCAQELGMNAVNQHTASVLASEDRN